MDPIDACHLLLCAAVFVPNLCDLLNPVSPTAEGEQVGKPLNSIHELGLHVCALGDEAVPGLATDELRKERYHKPQGDEEANEHESDGRVERPEEERNDNANEHRRYCGRNDTHVEVFQRLYVTDNTSQQVSA